MEEVCLAPTGISLWLALGLGAGLVVLALGLIFYEPLRKRIGMMVFAFLFVGVLITVPSVGAATADDCVAVADPSDHNNDGDETPPPDDDEAEAERTYVITDIIDTSTPAAGHVVSIGGGRLDPVHEVNEPGYSAVYDVDEDTITLTVATEEYPPVTDATTCEEPSDQRIQVLVYDVYYYDDPEGTAGTITSHGVSQDGCVTYVGAAFWGF